VAALYLKPICTDPATLPFSLGHHKKRYSTCMTKYILISLKLLSLLNKSLTG
jgi:hypothetical protein